jgi:hypothetical protein
MYNMFHSFYFLFHDRARLLKIVIEVMLPYFNKKRRLFFILQSLPVIRREKGIRLKDIIN